MTKIPYLNLQDLFANKPLYSQSGCIITLYHKSEHSSNNSCMREGDYLEVNIALKQLGLESAEFKCSTHDC